MDDLSCFCCQNPACSDYGLRGRDNLRVGFRYGKYRRLMLVCRTGQSRFSERKGTALFATRLPQDKAIAVVRHLQEGCGVRQTGRGPAGLAGLRDGTQDAPEQPGGQGPGAGGVRHPVEHRGGAAVVGGELVR